MTLKTKRAIWQILDNVAIVKEQKNERRRTQRCWPLLFVRPVLKIGGTREVFAYSGFDFYGVNKARSARSSETTALPVAEHAARNYPTPMSVLPG